jgi:hypothetical protein
MVRECQKGLVDVSNIKACEPLNNSPFPPESVMAGRSLTRTPKGVLFGFLLGRFPGGLRSDGGMVLWLVLFPVGQGTSLLRGFAWGFG